jgi:CheY-like chemotaxis protein
MVKRLRCADAHYLSRAATPTRPRMSLPRVLFVDDEPAICSAITKLLKIHGIEVDAVTSGLEARRAIAKGYDALVMDFRLSDGEYGDSLYRALSAFAPHIANRTIFITGDISQPTHERIEATGCPMLVKPFEIGLRAAVQSGADSTAQADRSQPRGSRSA